MLVAGEDAHDRSEIAIAIGDSAPGLSGGAFVQPMLELELRAGSVQSASGSRHFTTWKKTSFFWRGSWLAGSQVWIPTNGKP